MPVAEPNSSGAPDRVILETLSASLGAEQPLRIKPYLQNLALQFESLGGTGHGCEFGIFQRSLGVEPLGLLRWADLGPDQLARALETEFEGVGSPENAIIFVRADDGRPEYWVRDRRYHMAMRCFAYPDEIPYEKMRGLLERRFKFLSEKLIADLRAGLKIFVYKNLKHNLTDDELRRLHSAVRRYGDNTLFYIKYADDQHPKATAEPANVPGLILGYTDRFTNAPDTDENLGSTTEILRNLCAAALPIWLSGVTQSRLPWTAQKHIFIFKEEDGRGFLRRSGFTLTELIGADPCLGETLLLGVYPVEPQGAVLWDSRSPAPWLDPGMRASSFQQREDAENGKVHENKKQTRDPHWSYDSGPPQRYTVNFGTYRASGGSVSPVEDMERFSPGGKGSEDSGRFWFFCLLLDQLQKEALEGDIAEVGVYKGHTAALLATIARRLNKTAFLFDTFEGFAKQDLVGLDAHRKCDEFSDTSLEAVRTLVGEENTQFIEGYFPASTKDIPQDSKFCLVHIDCDLYVPIMNSLEYFYPRMVPGGFILVHDYDRFMGWNGAEKAVDDFFADKPECVIPLFDRAGSAVVRRAKSGTLDNWQQKKTERLLNRGWVSAGNNELAFLLGGGWSGPEPWGVWGVGKKHELRIFVPCSVRGDLHLEFDTHAYLVGLEAIQEVNVVVNGEPISEWRFTQSENNAARSALLRTSDLLTASAVSVVHLTFELRHQFSNSEGRPLGMALHRVKIEERFPK